MAIFMFNHYFPLSTWDPCSNEKMSHEFGDFHLQGGLLPLFISIPEHFSGSIKIRQKHYSCMYNFVCLYINRTITRFIWKQGMFGNWHTRPTSPGLGILQWAIKRRCHCFCSYDMETFTCLEIHHLETLTHLEIHKVVTLTNMKRLNLETFSGNGNSLFDFLPECHIVQFWET